MIRIHRILLTLMATLLLVAAGARADEPFIPKTLLIRGDDGAQVTAQNKLVDQGFPITPVREYPAFSIWLYKIDVQLTPPERDALRALLDSLVNDGEILDGDFDVPVRVDRGIGQTGSLWVSGMNRSQFDNQYAFPLTGAGAAANLVGGLGVTVAIIDSGLVEDAPVAWDLSLQYGYDFVTGTGTRAGIPVDIDYPNTPGSYGVGHGTFIAGLIGGVAPGARHLHLKVLDDEGACNLSDVVGALQACLEENVHVVNMSLVPTIPTNTLAFAITRVRDNGAIVIASAGNSAQQVNPYLNSEDALIQVGATGPTDHLWPPSPVTSWVDVVAPGVSVSNGQGGVVPQQSVIGPLGRTSTGQEIFAAASGTSFSAALVSGAAAAYRSANPGWPDDNTLPESIASRFAEDVLNAGAPTFMSDGASAAPYQRLDAYQLVANLPPVPRCPRDIVPSFDPATGHYLYSIDAADAAVLLAKFGSVVSDPRQIELADLDGDRIVGPMDLARLKGAWTTAPSPTCQ